MARLELNQHIDVASGSEVISQNGTKKRQLSDVVTLTEFSYFLAGNFYLQLVHGSIIANMLAVPKPHYQSLYIPRLELLARHGTFERRQAQDHAQNSRQRAMIPQHAVVEDQVL